MEVRGGSNEFANPEGFDFDVVDVEFADVNEDGTEEAIVLTKSFSGETARTDIGVFALDPKRSRFAYLAGVIPGALGGSSDSPGHVEKIEVMDGAVIVYRYQGAVKPPVGYEPVGSHYRIETWHWDGGKMVEDEGQAYTEQIPERFAWPDYGAWCRDRARDGYEQDACEEWLSP